MERIGHNPVTPVIGAALAAVGAAALIGFALLAQVTARGPFAPGTGVRSGTGSSGDIVLPALLPEALAAGLNETGRSIVGAVAAAITPGADVAVASADDALPPLSLGNATDRFAPRVIAPSRPSKGSGDEVATRPITGPKKGKQAHGNNGTRTRPTNDGGGGHAYGSRSDVKGSSGPSSAGVKSATHGTKSQAKGPVGKPKAQGSKHQAKDHHAKSKSRRSGDCRR
ncbi:MAG: hypothetical protein GEU78_08680 [Actinobacteria bacterium]|nr:hypothetical protein [Actinomycetota bacterium]